MIRHLIKLIWNKKRSNFLLTTEIFVSFLVLFGVMSLATFNYTKYTQPLGFTYEDVWSINYSRQDLSDSLYQAAMVRAGQHLRNRPEIRTAALSSSNTPFSFTTIGWNIFSDDRSINAEVISTDEHYPEVLETEMLEGRWFNSRETAGGEQVVVLNQQAWEALFGNEPAVGKAVFLEEQREQAWKVVGVTGNFKNKGDFQEAAPIIFINYKTNRLGADAFLIKVKPGADAQFEAALLKELSGIARGANIELSYLTDQRRQQNNIVRVPMLIAAIVSGFLLLNVGLGLFGVLWLNIRKRRGEIGLRRALGATRQRILGQFVGEAVVITTFGAVVALFFTIQFPLLDVFGLDRLIYLKAMAASLLILFTLVVACALYPSREAARMQPSAVLHEE